MPEEDAGNARQDNACPLTGEPGTVLRSFAARELAALYASYFGHALSEPLVEKYFTGEVREYYCSKSGLTWYSKARLGEGDFYQYLNEQYDWYYNEDTWDKRWALDSLKKNGISSFVEVGCGDGTFLASAAREGIQGIGVDINAESIKMARSRGLRAYLERDFPEDGLPETLVMLQVLEHVPNPLQFLQSYVERVKGARILIAVPSSESVLPLLSDPLSWPPHHCTMWSLQAFRTLARRLGLQVSSVARQPTNFQRFCDLWSHETRRESPIGTFPHENVVESLPSRLTNLFLRGPLWTYRYPDSLKSGGPPLGRVRWLLARIAGKRWARYDHSIGVVLEKRPTEVR